MNITPIVYGKTTLPESMIFKGGSKNVVREILLQIFVIETEGRKILIDAGCVTMPGFVVEDFIGPVAALAKIGISPLEITDLILTHHHHDHVECTAEFSAATVYIQSEELLHSKRFIPDEMTVAPFAEACDVCRGVRVIRVGGHTAGSSVVEVTDGDVVHVFVGDEWYMRECLDKKIPTGVSSNDQRSSDFITKYANGDYVVHLSHDV